MFQVIILYLLIATCLVKPELFTALVEMEELFETESVLIENLEKYINLKYSELKILKTKLALFKQGHNAIDSNKPSSYISNPITAFLITKRLITDWNETESLMSYIVNEDFLENTTDYREKLKFPSAEDLNGAAVALMRLQDTYNLDTSSIARGELNGIQSGVKMSASDCFELGRQAHLNADYYHSAMWMEEAMSRLTEEQNQSITLRFDILDYLAFARFKQGNVESALELTNKLSELRPDLEFINFHQRGDDGSEAVVDEEPSQHKVTPLSYNTSDYRLYKSLCRNEIRRPERELAKLHCRYITNTSSFLKISPLKLEEAHLDPYIVIYHDVMYDNEINVLKTLAKSRLKRAEVRSQDTGEAYTADFRISKSASLDDNEHKFVRNIGIRVGDMTGLSMESAEQLQVMNYGIGGHFEPHFDFAQRIEDFERVGEGNRIATVLFYMSDVVQGGATVFPLLNTALWPKKGTAAVWMNLYKSGEGNPLTIHAGCPVLLGNKWISTKWLHLWGQERKRPCGLGPDTDERFLV